MIPFTQYLMPNGRKVRTEIDMPAAIEEMAHRFIRAGGWFESEMLSDYKHVSLTACWHREDGDNDIAIRVVQNDTAAVAGAVEDIVRAAILYLENQP